MRRQFAVALAVLLLTVPLCAQNGSTITNALRRSFAKEPLTVSTVAVIFTVATYAPSGVAAASMARFVVEGCAVRVWTDGSTPTATVGQKMNIGDVGTIYGNHDITTFKAIRDTSCAVDATLQTVYSK